MRPEALLRAVRDTRSNSARRNFAARALKGHDARNCCPKGEILEAVVIAKRDQAAALKLLKRIIKRYGAPEVGRHRRASGLFYREG